MDNTNLMQLNLQYFADEGGVDGDQGQNPPPAEQDTPPAAEDTKPADLTAMMAADKTVQSQFDQLVGKALATARGKWEREQNMTAEELANVKSQEREQGIAAREQALLERETRADALNLLIEKGLPPELIDSIVCTDAAAMKACVDKTEKAFRASVEKAVTEKLKGTPPPAGGGTNSEAAQVNAAFGL